MKRSFLLLLLTLVCSAGYAQTKYEYKQMTAVESVVPGGLGRSRLTYTDEKGEKQEVDLDNFFSMVGINFGNIRDNDKTLVRMINEFSDAGWELFSSNSGVYSGQSSTGIFITRYLFRRPKSN